MFSVQSNIWKLFLIRAIRSFILTIPILTLFLQENGLSMSQVLLLQSLFSMVTIGLEVPTGHFADLHGRKTSIMIGGVLSAIGFGVYSLSYDFWGFLLAEVLLGVAISFVNGADSALLYDTLLECGVEHRSQELEGKNQSIATGSEGVASIIGGMLALISLRFPLYCDALVMLLILPVAYTLVEPVRHQPLHRENGLKRMYRLMRYSLHDHKELKWLTLYSGSVAASTLTMVWFIQPYLVAIHTPLSLFGPVWAALMFIASFFSWHASFIEGLLGRKWALYILTLLPAVGYAITGSFTSPWAGICIGLFYVTRGIHNPILSSYINGLVESEIRATILSVKNLVRRLIFSVIGPLVGWIHDACSLENALAVSGTVFFVFGFIALVSLRKHNAL